MEPHDVAFFTTPGAAGERLVEITGRTRTEVAS